MYVHMKSRTYLHNFAYMNMFVLRFFRFLLGYIMHPLQPIQLPSSRKPRASKSSRVSSKTTSCVSARTVALRTSEVNKARSPK